MPSNAVIIIAVVVVLALGAVAAYFIARFMRGSVKISLPRTSFNPGDPIDGSLELLTKKEIQGNKLVVSLIGTEVTKTYEDGKTETKRREVYKDEVLIEDARTYPAGHTSRHDFKLSAPDMNRPEFMNSALGQTLSTALSILSNSDKELTWKVVARLDAKGIDLASSESVSIHI